MDNPATESGELDVSQAASEMARLLEPPAGDPPTNEPADPPAAQPSKQGEDKPAAETPEETDDSSADETITIEVDGKNVQIKRSELPDLYKGQLRQADYTKKTMEVAEQRKAAESETAKAREERQQYAQGLNQSQALLQAQLQEQSQIDWQKLLDTDPVEYLKQQRIAQDRHAQLQRVQQEQGQLAARQQAENAQQMHAFLRDQQQELLAKLPDWNDESKAKAEKAQIKDYLKAQGFEDQALERISDHRAVLLARKAMLYDQVMDKAQAAAKKVQQLPQKVERPGSGQVSVDGRTRAMQKLTKSGSLDDAAAVFASIL